MSVSPRSRGEATRAKLVAAARELFGERGYAEVGTEEVVRRAGVTRGALYHHFEDKRDLFRAVYEQTEEELVAEVAGAAAGVEDPWEVLTIGVRVVLEATSEPAIMRIGALDAPVVLEWQERRDIAARYALGLVTASLQHGMDQGVLRPAAVEPLARLWLGTLSEAAQLVANAEDPESERVEVERTLLMLLEGLRA